MKSQYAALDHTKFWVQESGVGIATYYGLTVRALSRGGDNKFAVLKSVPNGPQVHSAFCTMGTVVLP